MHDHTTEAQRLDPKPIDLRRDVRLDSVHEMSDAFAVAAIVTDPDGTGFDAERPDMIWKRRERDLLAAFVLHVLLSSEYEKKTLGTIYEILSDTRLRSRQKFAALLNARHDPGLKRGWKTPEGMPTSTHPFVAAMAQAQLDRPEQEAGAVQSGLQSCLCEHHEEADGANVDLTIADLMRDPLPPSQYIIRAPDAKPTDGRL